ncbi:MAG: HPr family phosphocarrier protein [Candidatus Eisenbacteria bacterium]|uniref:HPr family phosphocarrier protein n=1 Tax=Eiseniibacteriota bacterium TaxID=2212470 RepID=A0A948RUL0_UNCEI|nr:HPr family phosphocarrier protein [Candidatus Eisenbacteria bacterium]MBU1950123.1 HPr family phosphocarrier protein [Candidatus Eisenbacteria bacterium]MBU2689833.1 HPr family phosphocarrier protein [Candidatus Eisenbacteria bacterium]
MFESEVRVPNIPGIHARPAAELVKYAARFASEIFLEANDLTINAKSIMGVMMLAAVTGTILKVRAVGPDESQAVQGVVDLISSGFGEEMEDAPEGGTKATD